MGVKFSRVRWSAETAHSPELRAWAVSREHALDRLGAHSGRQATMLAGRAGAALGTAYALRDAGARAPRVRAQLREARALNVLADASRAFDETGRWIR